MTQFIMANGHNLFINTKLIIYHSQKLMTQQEYGNPQSKGGKSQY